MKGQMFRAFIEESPITFQNALESERRRSRNPNTIINKLSRDFIRQTLIKSENKEDESDYKPKPLVALNPVQHKVNYGYNTLVQQN